MAKKTTTKGKKTKKVAPVAPAIGHTDECTFHNDRTRCSCGRLAADAKNEGGRDSKLTIEVHAAILKSILNGATRTDAAIAAGITYQTYKNWMKRGEEFDKLKEDVRDEKELPFFEFFVDIKKAEAECANEMVGIVRKAAARQWQAAAWFLERRRREDYALRREITGKDGEDLIPSRNFPTQRNDDAGYKPSLSSRGVSADARSG